MKRKVVDIKVAFNGDSKDIVDAYATFARWQDSGEVLTDHELDAIDPELIDEVAFDAGGWH